MENRPDVVGKDRRLGKKKTNTKIIINISNLYLNKL